MASDTLTFLYGKGQMDFPDKSTMSAADQFYSLAV
jgi:hypothetical protein